MSAYLVADEHISAMLKASAPRYPGDGATYCHGGTRHPFGGHAQEIGQKLLDENYRSMNYRYSEDDKPHRFQLRMVRSCSAVELIKLVHCYQCQSCETPDWEQTEGYAIAAVLEGRAIRKLPGYDEAAWGFDPQSVPLPRNLPPPRESLTREETIKRIRAALKRKTGKSWTVRGGRGTGWGWIRVESPPRRRVHHETVGDPRDPDFLNKPYEERFREVAPAPGVTACCTPLAEAREIAAAFGDGHKRLVSDQGLSISPDAWEAYVEMVEA